MIEQYVNGKLTRNDSIMAVTMQHRHIDYGFDRPMTHADSLRVDSIKRVMAVKDSIRKAEEDKLAKERAAADEQKAKEEQKKKEEKQGKPLNDPAVIEDNEPKRGDGA